MRNVNLSGRALLLAAGALAGSAGASAGPVEVTAAYQVPNVAPEADRPEGNEAINAARQAHPDLGSLLHLYVRNGSAKPLDVKEIAWDGAGLAARMGKPEYQVIWWRLLPNPLPSGREGEIALCLRRKLQKATAVTVTFGDGSTARATLAPEAPAFRIGTLAFAPGLRRAFLYVEALGGQAPASARVTLDGVPLNREVRWLGNAPAGGVRVAVVTPRQPFEQGRPYTFRVASGGQVVAATLRAFTDLARFGTYGYADLERYAAAGVNAYAGFGQLRKASLDRAWALGERVAMTVGIEKAPPAETVGHPALFGYLISDEPDCQDYGADKERPMHLRIGTLGQKMVRSAEICARADARTPTRITTDLTFTPANYFVYSPISDVPNSDCYPVTIGWPIRAIREKAAVIKRASAPRPFTFTYQGCWEECAIPQPTWVGRAAIRREGWQKFVDLKKVRGFGRAPTPAEVRMQMLYAIGCGARGLFSYTDATEAGGPLIFHSSEDLPEVWQEIGRTSRALRTVARLIEVSHPLTWARTETPDLWTSTLLCGDLGALVVVVNERGECGKEGFKLRPAYQVGFRFPDLPWLSGKSVLRVEDGGFTPMPAGREGKALSWTDPEVEAAALYLVPAHAWLPGELALAAQSEVPVATEEGKRPGPESYLRGRRSRW